MTQVIENYDPYVKDAKGISTKLPITTIGSSATVTVGGGLTVTGTTSLTGGITATGGETGPGTEPTVFHSGGVQLFGALTTNYHQTQFVSTDTYYCEVFIPVNTTLTGISVLNGGTTSASQNTNVGLANSAGVIVASSATTTAQSTANAYQQIPFSAPYAAIGPAKYYIAVQGSNTTGYLATHTAGNFGAALKTSETYGTFVTTASYAVTTFTTAQGPIADTY